MMKKSLLFSAVIALGVLSSPAWAATELSNGQTGNLRAYGTVSVQGATHLDQLQDELANKAKQEGATGYVITSAGGDNLLHGTATLYR
ncbi:hypothetical protein TUM12370_26270 [Salmonella enterica subsp. enterica serovar Choleraesuis]|nr:hypothetical protein TUM12370_26270 [Salmonella enterica subsp. enterica serovar Choleraesuis]